MSEVLKLVGARIRDIRKSKGLSQEALAEKAGFNSSYIGFVERAERNVSIINLEKIASALNVRVDQLFFYVQEQEDLLESDTYMKEIIALLQHRDTKDLAMSKHVLLEIFRRLDGE